MKRIKRFFKRLAAMVVTAYGNRIYKKAVKAAEERHSKEGEMIYVSNGVINGTVLRTYNRKQFRNAKRILGINSKMLTCTKLKAAAWYHTANRAQQDAMTPRDKELRRLAFIKFLLQNAKLA